MQALYQLSYDPNEAVKLTLLTKPYKGGVHQKKFLWVF